MTRLNYSNLPPEAQDAIKKLTGYSDEKLNGDKAKQPEPKPAKARKAKPRTLKKIGYQILLYLVPILIILAIVSIVSFIATTC
jgi:hypothetical protein